MTIQAQDTATVETVDATVSAPALVATPSGPAPIGYLIVGDVVKRVVKTQRDYEKAIDRAETNRLVSTWEAFKGINVPMTAAQFNGAFSKDLKAKAKKAKIEDVASLVTRATRIGLFALWAGEEASQPLGGESLNAYVARARAALENAQLPNGDWVYPRNADGSAKKTGPKTGSTKTDDKPATGADAPKTDDKPATGADVGSAGKTGDGATHADPVKAKAQARENAATVLMGDAKKAAALLALLETPKGREALAKLLANASV